MVRVRRLYPVVAVVNRGALRARQRAYRTTLPTLHITAVTPSAQTFRESTWTLQRIGWLVPVAGGWCLLLYRQLAEQA